VWKLHYPGFAVDALHDPIAGCEEKRWDRDTRREVPVPNGNVVGLAERAFGDFSG